MDMEDTTNALLNLDMDTPQALVIITGVLKEFRDTDTEGITRDLLSQDIIMVMAIPMFIRIENLIMDPMDMKLITTTKSVLQSQDMDMEVTAMCTEQLKALPEDTMVKEQLSLVMDTPLV